MEEVIQKKDVSNEFIIRGPLPIYEPAQGGLGYEIFRSLNLNKGKTAQIFVEEGTFDSYDNLLQRCTRTAVYLKKKQLKKDDIVCLCSENELNSMVPFISSTFVGTTYASIEPSMSDDDVIYLLNYIRPKILFVSEQHEEKIESCVNKSNIICELIIFGDTKKHIRFSDLLVPSEEEKTFQPVFVNDLYETAVIYLSSGTTGNSKGICLNHYSLIAQTFNLFHYNYRQGVYSLSNFSQKYDDKEEHRFLFYAPMYWLTGSMISLGLFFSGGTRVVGSFFSGKNVWEAIKKYQPDTMFFPPILANEICMYGMNNEANLHHKIFIIYGGGVTDILWKTIKKCFPTSTIVQGYGQTENTGLLTGFNVGDPEEINLIEKHPESCGRIMPTFEMKVVDIDNEKILPKGGRGELRVKDKYIMNGYYKMDSSSAFDSDGWFKTGDVVYFDEDDCLHIVDRVKDIIDYALHWIHPSTIEQILYQHPAVFENFVFGYPHPTDTERTYAVVVLKDEYKNKVTKDELIDFVNERVPNDWYKIRAGLTFLDKMLKTPTGKLRRLAMKQAIIEKKV